tara:strand:- start:192 stop:656 length:465 start_codon:yes stop_codon:yes gene_type:complete
MSNVIEEFKNDNGKLRKNSRNIYNMNEHVQSVDLLTGDELSLDSKKYEIIDPTNKGRKPFYLGKLLHRGKSVDPLHGDSFPSLYNDIFEFQHMPNPNESWYINSHHNNKVFREVGRFSRFLKKFSFGGKRKSRKQKKSLKRKSRKARKSHKKRR